MRAAQSSTPIPLRQSASWASLWSTFLPTYPTKFVRQQRCAGESLAMSPSRAASSHRAHRPLRDDTTQITCPSPMHGRTQGHDTKLGPYCFQRKEDGPATVTKSCGLAEQSQSRQIRKHGGLEWLAWNCSQNRSGTFHIRSNLFCLAIRPSIGPPTR